MPPVLIIFGEIQQKYVWRKTEGKTTIFAPWDFNPNKRPVLCNIMEAHSKNTFLIIDILSII